MHWRLQRIERARGDNPDYFDRSIGLLVLLVAVVILVFMAISRFGPQLFQHKLNVPQDRKLPPPKDQESYPAPAQALDRA